MNLLRQVVYNTLFLVGFVFSLPHYGWRLWKRGQVWKDFGHRLGRYDDDLRKRLSPGCDLWIHAVSVGEVRLAGVLLHELADCAPGLRIVITTTTQTGLRVARRLETDRVTAIYSPIDFLWAVRGAYALIRPKRLVLVEAEIWPNLVWCARRRKIPIMVVNARLSERTEGRYRAARWLVEPILRELSLVLAQDDEDVERLAGAGFPPEAIFNVGSMKYDVANGPVGNLREIDGWWARLGWPEDAPVLLAASTHAGEEDIFAKLYLELREEHPELRLILAPRHAERGHQIRGMADRLGLATVLRTQLDAGAPDGPAPNTLVLNSTGELAAVYGKATVTFVGKSLRSRGGQNFIEATRMGRAVVVGPNMQNFKNLVTEFVRGDGIRQVTDERELAIAVRELLADPAAARALGERAAAIFERNLGAGRRTAKILADSLRDVAPAAVAMPAASPRPAPTG